MWTMDMNDFTKDELQIILLDMDTNILKAPPLRVADMYLQLRDKVDAMIDDYCEHEWRMSGIDAIYCPKCQKHVDYQI